jgi:hypothetical protein
MPKLHVHIGHHFFGAGNIGDDLMLAGFLEAAGPAWLDQLTLTCCIPHPAGSQRLRFPEIEWLPYDEAARAEAIARCDVWLGLGGTPFQIHVGPWLLDHLIQEAAVCRLHGKPMFYLGVGVNEPEVMDDPRMRVLLGQAEKIWTRDEDCAAMLRRLADPGKIVAGADLAHVALAGMRFEPPDPGTLGLVLNFEDPAQYSIEQIAALIAASGARRIVWAMQEVRSLSGSEAMLYEQLPAATSALLTRCTPDYAGAATLAELVRPWGVPAALFTSRYHGLLLGAWMGCRTVAFERCAKVAGGARQMGVPLVDDLGDTEGILGFLANAEPVPGRLLQAYAALARSICDAFLTVANARSAA